MDCRREKKGGELDLSLIFLNAAQMFPASTLFVHDAVRCVYGGHRTRAEHETP